MSRTLEALKRAEARRFAQPTGSPLGSGLQAKPDALPPRPAGSSLLAKVWVAVAVLALVAALCGWWAFGPAFTVRLGQGAVASVSA